MHRYHNRNNNTKVGKVFVGLMGLSTFALADVAQDLGLSATSSGDKLTRMSEVCRHRGGVKWLPQASKCACRSGREWNASKKACLYTTESKECQKGNGKHFSTNKNRCICHKDSVYNKALQACQSTETAPRFLNPAEKCTTGQVFSIESNLCEWTEESQGCQAVGGNYWIEKLQRCQCPTGKMWDDDIEQCKEFCTGGTAWDEDVQACEETYKSKECRETKKGKYFMETTKSCVCQDGLFWDCFDEMCVDLDASIEKFKLQRIEEAKSLEARTWYIQRKIEKEILLRKWRLIEKTRIERAEHDVQWAKMKCFQGQYWSNVDPDPMLHRCDYSEMTKVCKQEWRAGDYYLGKGKGCACYSGQIWDKDQVRCTIIGQSVDSESKCGPGRAFDTKKMKCRWTKNSRICHRRGGLYSFISQWVDLCKCPSGSNWNGKICEGSPQCKEGSFFDGLTQKCELSRNSENCQKRGGLFYRQDGKCECPAEDSVWNEETEGCVKINQQEPCELGEFYSYEEETCVQTDNSARCVGMGALYYDKEEETCKCNGAIFDLKNRVCDPNFSSELEQQRLDYLFTRRSEEEKKDDARAQRAAGNYKRTQVIIAEGKPTPVMVLTVDGGNNNVDGNIDGGSTVDENVDFENEEDENETENVVEEIEEAENEVEEIEAENEVEEIEAENEVEEIEAENEVEEIETENEVEEIEAENEFDELEETEIEEDEDETENEEDEDEETGDSEEVKETLFEKLARIAREKQTRIDNEAEQKRLSMIKKAKAEASKAGKNAIGGLVKNFGGF